MTASPIVLAVLLTPLVVNADQVPVRYREGRVHGFLVLRDREGKILASGSSLQSASGNRVTAELTFHFPDGSLYQESTAFSQGRTFHLLTYHLIQKGPVFKRATDVSLTASTGQVHIQYQDDDGKTKTISERMKLPADLANGMVTTLLYNIDAKTPKTVVSMLVATPKPRLVKLHISPAGEDSFTIAGAPLRTIRYVVKVEIGGISGVIAPLVGKQPPDTHVWIVGGKAPGFVASEGPLFEDGPLWRIELSGPVWPKPRPAQKQ
jgi:hypothetical protein